MGLQYNGLSRGEMNAFLLFFTDGVALNKLIIVDICEVHFIIKDIYFYIGSPHRYPPIIDSVK